MEVGRHRRRDRAGQGHQPRVASSSDPGSLTAVGGTLYFTAKDGAHGIELWKSDGTSAGTALVKDIAVGISSSYPSDLTAVGGTLYFTAGDENCSYGLWKTDGTTAGTVLVKQLQHRLQPRARRSG